MKKLELKHLAAYLEHDVKLHKEGKTLGLTNTYKTLSIDINTLEL